MIPSVYLSNYYQIASMSQSLNNFIREAMLARAELNSSLLQTEIINYPSDTGRIVDVYA